jgi:hypothetical protein
MLEKRYVFATYGYFSIVCFAKTVKNSWKIACRMINSRECENDYGFSFRHNVTAVTAATIYTHNEVERTPF